MELVLCGGFFCVSGAKRGSGDVFSDKKEGYY